MKTQNSRFRTFFAIAFFYTLLIFVWLISTPSLSGGNFLLNYSLQRFILICFTGLCLIVWIVCFLLCGRKPLQTLWNHMFSSKVLFFLSSCAVFLVFLIVVGYGVNFAGLKNKLIERAFPIILLVFFFTVEFVLFQQISSKEEIGRSVKSSISSFFTNAIQFLNTLFCRFLKITDHSWVTVVLLLLINAPIIFINAIRFRFPMGFAGLYSLMAEEIVTNHFVLPMSVPFYGPGGIPFAYPPLAFYLMGFFIGPLHVPSIVFLRFASPLFFLVSSVLFYFIARQYTKSRMVGFISSILFAFSSLNYYIQGTSGGAVRGLALCFLFAGLLSFINNFSKQKTNVFFCGLFFALTILTHLGYAFIFAIVLFISIVVKPFIKQRWIRVFFIALIGLILSSPWWITIISRYSWDVFVLAFGSHGNSYMFRVISGEKGLLDWLSVSFGAFTLNPYFAGIALIGLVFMLVQGDLFFSLLFFILMFTSSENGRFLVMLGSIPAAMVISKVGLAISNQKNQKHWQILAVFFSIVTLFIVCKPEVDKYLGYQPVVTEELVTLSKSIKAYSSDHSEYLFIIGSGDQEAEWLPYFLEMTPSVGPWGSEWLDYAPKQTGTMAVAGCHEKQSFSCVKQTMSDLNLHPDFLVTFAHEKINDDIKLDQNWREVMTNDRYILWEANTISQ